MKTKFPGFFSNTASDIEKMWDECIFVLDANVLLNLYRYSDSTCEKLLQVFEGLGERLWIPHQVALEYLNNRLAVIGEQGKVYDDAIKKVDLLKRSLESHNQHPFVSEDTLKASLAVFESLVGELGENKRIHDVRISADEIKDKLGDLLEGKVGPAFARERLEQILVDGALRYEQKVPPGFCDLKKLTDSNVFSERCRPYGDYIVWLQILDKAMADRKPVVFVTGDAKEDWWSSFQGKTLGPQPQLVEEFLTIVGAGFYMYPPDRFLERASEYLNQAASEEAVKEIRNIRVDDTDNLLLDLALNHKWPKSYKTRWRTGASLDRWNGGVPASEWAALSEMTQLKVKEKALRKSLAEARARLEIMNDLKYDLSMGGMDEADSGMVQCLESIEDLSIVVAQLSHELESIHRAFKSFEAGNDTERKTNDES